MRKPKAYLPAVLILFVGLGCGRSHNSEDARIAPSGKYYLSTEIREAPESGQEHVFLILRDRSEAHLDSYDTLASPIQKWAVGWLDGDDVVVLYSSDIGTYAYEISEGKLSPIELSPEATEKGRELYGGKYR